MNNIRKSRGSLFVLEEIDQDKVQTVLNDISGHFDFLHRFLKFGLLLIVSRKQNTHLIGHFLIYLFAYLPGM